MGGYFQSTPFEERVLQAKSPITFYDSVTGKPLFVAPINRSPEEFLQVRGRLGSVCGFVLLFVDAVYYG
jgi:hypothetical protein